MPHVMKWNDTESPGGSPRTGYYSIFVGETDLTCPLLHISSAWGVAPSLEATARSRGERYVWREVRGDRSWPLAAALGSLGVRRMTEYTLRRALRRARMYTTARVHALSCRQAAAVTAAQLALGLGMAVQMSESRELSGWWETTIPLRAGEPWIGPSIFWTSPTGRNRVVWRWEYNTVESKRWRKDSQQARTQACAYRVGSLADLLASPLGGEEWCPGEAYDSSPPSSPSKKEIIFESSIGIDAPRGGGTWHII